MFHATHTYTILSDRLSRHLCNKRLTQAEFAKKANVGSATISRCLSPFYVPSTTVYRKIAKAMDVDPDTLAKRDDKEEKKTPDDFDKFFYEDFAPTFKTLVSYNKACERRERIKFALISVCGFIVITAWFLMLYVAFQS